MKTFREWYIENYEKELPTSMDGAWFSEHNLPMVVECICCGTTMALPSAYIDRNGYTCCTQCCGAELS